MKNANNTTNVNPVKITQTVHKEKINSVRSANVAIATGTDATTIAKLYVDNPMGATMYQPFAMATVANIVNNDKDRTMEDVTKLFDQFFASLETFKLVASFSVSYGENKAYGLKYCKVAPIAISNSKDELSESEFQKRLSVIFSDFTNLSAFVGQMKDTTILQELYAYTQLQVAKSESVDQYLYGIEDSIGVVRWAYAINFEKALSKLNDGSDNS